MLRRPPRATRTDTPVPHTPLVRAGVAVLLGCDPAASPLEWLAAAGLLLLYVLARSWVSAMMGLLAGTPDAAVGFTFIILFLPYVSRDRKSTRLNSSH